MTTQPRLITFTAIFRKFIFPKSSHHGNKCKWYNA
jgi:hypothetical protein